MRCRALYTLEKKEGVVAYANSSPCLLDDAAAVVDEEDAAHAGDGGRAAVRGEGPALQMIGLEYMIIYAVQRLK